MESTGLCRPLDSSRGGLFYGASGRARQTAREGVRYGCAAYRQVTLYQVVIRIEYQPTAGFLGYLGLDFMAHVPEGIRGQF